LPSTDVRDAHAYLDAGIDTIPGWFDPRDAMMWLVIDGLQRGAKVRGDLLEIGVFLGKSAVLLGYLAQPGETLTVCDLFEDEPEQDEVAAEHERFYQGLSRERFEANYLRFHEALPDVIQGSSTEALAELEDESFRFIHVDGSHAYDVVREDVSTARRLSGPGSIVVFDDIFTGHTPGVCAAVWDAVVHEGLRPLATTNKLYGTWSDDAFAVDDLARALDHHASLRVNDTHTVAGHTLLEIARPPSATRSNSLLHELTPPGAAKVVRKAQRRLRDRRTRTTG
jgi:hypothetical protein